MPKLGVLGGTFDPIHMGHLIIAETTREALYLDKILFVPAGNPPHKQHLQKTAAHHRQNMVAQAIGANPYFELCSVDLERSGPHYSIDTVALIREQYNLLPAHCYFIIGGDSLVDLPTWHKPEQLIKLCRLAVVYRPDYQPDVEQLEQHIPGVSQAIETVPLESAIDLAASTLRNRVQTGQSIRYLVPDTVRLYIEQNKLYLASSEN